MITWIDEWRAPERGVDIEKAGREEPAKENEKKQYHKGRKPREAVSPTLREENMIMEGCSTLCT